MIATDGEPGDGRAAIGKVNRRLLPMLCAMHIVQFLDLTSMAFAALQMNQTVGLSPTVFGLGGSAFFATYALCEIPSNMAFARWGARRWLSRIMLTWGLVTVATMFVANPRQFIGLRLALGAAQAGFVPATVIYLGRWYAVDGRAQAMGTFLAAPAFGGIIAGPLAAALLSLNGALALSGWQWLFLIEGSLAIGLAFVVFRHLPETPNDSSWLSVTEIPRLRLTTDATPRHAGLSDLWAAMKRRTVWKLAAINFSINASLFAMDLWTPQILQARGNLSTMQIGLGTIVPNIAAALGMIGMGAHADRSREYRWHIVIPVLLAAMGLILAGMANNVVMLIVALCLARLCVLSAGPFWAITTWNLRRTEDAAGVACVTTVGVLTGVVWPFIVGLARDATGSFTAGLLILAAALIGGAILVVTLRLQEPTEELATSATGSRAAEHTVSTVVS